MNQGRKGWTELRVHGVSGTPPDRMLQHAQIDIVAGDADAGFYRRRYDIPDVPDGDNDQQRAEAYSWGGLTAGAGARALWLLLAPFMLANLAFFALPEVTVGGQKARARIRVAREALVRLFALSVTVTFVLVPVQVAMDLIGWQCVRPGVRDCTAQTSWLGFLNWRWLATPGGRLAVTALVPLLVVVLLWRLGRSTWLRLEKTAVPDAVALATDQTPLEDRNMWNGREPVRRLRAVHLAAALAVVGAFLVAPIRHPVASVVLWIFVGSLALAAVLVCVPAIGRRKRPGENGAVVRFDRYTAFPLAVTVVVAVAGIVAASAGRGSFRDEPSLPGLAGTVQGLFTVQLVMLLVLAVLLLTLSRMTPPPAVGPVGDREGEAYEDRPAWRGLAAAALMMLALAFTGEIAAGAGIRVADLLGTPSVDYENPSSFLVPGGYFSAAAVTAVLLLALLVAALLGWRHVHGEATAIQSGMEPFYDDTAGAEHAERRKVIADVWARAEVGEVAQRLAGWLLVVAAVVLGTGLVVFWLDPSWLLDHARWLVNAGTFLVVGFLLLLLYVGRQAYRNANFRRTVGVLWDVGTFWPRAAHPLAPPCYTERTVPDLMTRIRYLGDECQGGKVLLSCHSQGTIIGAAVIMQLTYDESASVAFLTYGSPLRRLYCRFFPQYFNVSVLNRTGSFLLGCAHEDTPREHRPWRNLHRRSDPIGGPLLVTYPPRIPVPDGRKLVPAGDNDDLDRQLIDPRFDRPDGDTCDPAPCGHSNYFADPAFTDSVTKLRELREAYTSARGRCPGSHAPVRARSTVA